MAILAIALDNSGEHAEAVRVGRECLVLRQRVLGEEHEHTLITMHWLAFALLYLPDQEHHALDIIFRCSQLARSPSRTSLLTSFHLCKMDAVHALALSHNHLHEEAERMARSAVEQGESLEEEMLDIHIFALAALCEVLLRSGQPAECACVGREFLELRPRELGRKHRNTHNTMHHLSLALAQIGEYAEAARVERECLATRIDALVEMLPDTLESMSNLAAALQHLGDFSDAVRAGEECHALQDEPALHGEEYVESIQKMVPVLFRSCLALDIGTLGQEHPETEFAMHLLLTSHGRCCTPFLDAVRDLLAFQASRLDISSC